MLFYVLFLKAKEFAFLCPSLHVGPARGDERLLARRLLLAVGRLSMLRKRKQHRTHAMSMREADETRPVPTGLRNGGLGRALTNRFQLVTCWPSVLVIVWKSSATIFSPPKLSLFLSLKKPSSCVRLGLPGTLQGRTTRIRDRLTGGSTVRPPKLTQPW